MANGSDVASALGRLVGVLGEDAIFVHAAVPREAKEALDGVLARRAPAYTAAVLILGSYLGWSLRTLHELSRSSSKGR